MVCPKRTEIFKICFHSNIETQAVVPCPSSNWIMKRCAPSLPLLIYITNAFRCYVHTSIYGFFAFIVVFCLFLDLFPKTDKHKQMFVKIILWNLICVSNFCSSHVFPTLYSVTTSDTEAKIPSSFMKM